MGSVESDMTLGLGPKGHSHPVEKEIGGFQEQGLLEAKGSGGLCRSGERLREGDQVLPEAGVS